MNKTRLAIADHDLYASYVDTTTGGNVRVMSVDYPDTAMSVLLNLGHNFGVVVVLTMTKEDQADRRYVVSVDDDTYLDQLRWLLTAFTRLEPGWVMAGSHLYSPSPSCLERFIVEEMIDNAF